MKRRLLPIRTQRRQRFRLTWPTLVLPALAVVLLGRGEVMRTPLDETEATLAMAAHASGTAGVASAVKLEHERPAAALVPANLAGRYLTTGETHLRLPGLLLGAAALGAAVVLGERLFATRVGLLAALLLLFVPAARPLLGTHLGPEPIYLLAMLIAVAASRDVADARGSAIVAGLAGGVAIAVGGRDGFWIPILTLAWLRKAHGLTLQSARAVGASTLASTIAVTFVSALWIWRAEVSLSPLPLSLLLEPQLGFSLGGWTDTARSLVPLAPIALVGLSALPPEWWRNESLQFLLVWLVLAGGSLACSGSSLALFVAAIFVVATLAVWGLEHSRRAMAGLGLCASLALASLSFSAPSSSGDEQQLDRWAVREAGRFLNRTVAPDREIGAVAGVRNRLAYYGRRPVGPLPSSGRFAELDYVVMTRNEFRAATHVARAPADTPSASGGHGLRMVAEFGPWVIARVTSVGAESPRSGHAAQGLSGPPSHAQQGDFPQ